MEDALAIALVGALVAGLVFSVGVLMNRGKNNLCVKAQNQNFPFNETKGKIRSKYGRPKSTYQKGNSTRWVYTYNIAFTTSKCKMTVIFQNGKVVDYEMKEKGESGAEVLDEALEG